MSLFNFNFIFEAQCSKVLHRYIKCNDYVRSNFAKDLMGLTLCSIPLLVGIVPYNYILAGYITSVKKNGDFCIRTHIQRSVIYAPDVQSDTRDNATGEIYFRNNDTPHCPHCTAYNRPLANNQYQPVCTALQYQIMCFIHVCTCSEIYLYRWSSLRAPYPWHYLHTSIWFDGWITKYTSRFGIACVIWFFASLYVRLKIMAGAVK